MPNPADRDDDARPHESNEEIEVTPKMIEAGWRVMCLYEAGDSWESTVLEIYRAMESIRRKSGSGDS